MLKALRIFSENGGVQARIVTMKESELTEGEVLVRVKFSSVNFKDALAATGKGKILRRFPLNGGIDAAGIVEESSAPQFQKGQEVMVTGCNTGELYDGGYAEKIKVKAESLVHKPSGLNLRDTMIIGTAGFTAALALSRMEQNGQTPDKGPIVVTGASGGVGSFAVHLFSQRGYKVIAISGKPESVSYLKELGASEVLTPGALNLGDRPLEGVRFGGVVDNVGGDLLAKLFAHVQLWGNVCSIGLAESAELKTTVMPLILRGVSLLGVSSNNCPRPLRDEIWKNLAGAWHLPQLEKIVAKTVTLDELPQAFQDLLHRKIIGRILVNL